MIHIKSVVKGGALTMKRGTLLTAAAALSLAGLTPLIASHLAHAEPLTERSLMVTSTNPSDNTAAPDGSTYNLTDGSVPAGDPRNGARVGHTYTFTPSSGTNVESFSFQVCDSAFGYVDTCVTPSGFSAATIDNATVEVSVGGTPDAGWAVTGTPSANIWQVAKTGATSVTGGDPVEIKFIPSMTGYFVNPNQAYMTGSTNGTYFVHIVSFDGDDPSTDDEVDDGTVTNSVANSIRLYTRVQETLNFSVESDDFTTDPLDEGPSQAATPGGVCAPLTENDVLYLGNSNRALSTQQAYEARSYFRLATNATNGTVVYYSGDTLKSGSTVDIDPIGSTAVNSTIGSEQFGIALDNTAPGYSLTSVPSGLVPATAYTNGNGTISDPVPANNASFAFDAGSVANPVPIAQSTGVVNCETGAVRYVANIHEDTPAGIYQTKINYIASPKY